MSIADETHVRTVGNLPASLADAKITPHLRQAGRRLTRWVGSTNYAASQTEAAGLGSPRSFGSASAQCQALADAEAYLALAAGISSWNNVMESAGGTAAGISLSGTIGEGTYNYLTPEQIEKLRELYIRNAEDAAADYFDSDIGGGSPGPERSFAIDDCENEIDDDWPDDVQTC